MWPPKVPASEIQWPATAVRDSYDPKIQGMLGELQTVIPNMLRDITPHTGYHYGLPLPDLQTLPMHYLFARSVELRWGSPDTLNPELQNLTVGDRTVTYEDIQQSPSDYLVAIRESSRQELLGALGVLRYEHEAGLWNVELDDPTGYNHPRGSTSRFAVHTLEIGLRTRAMRPCREFLPACSGNLDLEG